MRKVLCFLVVVLVTSCSFSPADGGRKPQAPDWEATPFVFDGCKMYYRGKEFQVGWHIREYEKVFGKDYRRVDSIGSYGNDNIFTFDKAGVMMLGERYGTPAQKDTITQINIVFNYEFQELDFFTEREGLTDKMQIPGNYARPKQFYTKKIQLNGVELQFGPKGLSVQEAREKVKKVGLSFDPAALKYLWRCHIYCQPKVDYITTIYSLVMDKDPSKVQQMDILKGEDGF